MSWYGFVRTRVGINSIGIENADSANAFCGQSLPDRDELYTYTVDNLSPPQRVIRPIDLACDASVAHITYCFNYKYNRYNECNQIYSKMLEGVFTISATL